MNKLISGVSLAALGCMASGIAHADRYDDTFSGRTGTTGVIVYGVMNVDLDSVKTTSSGVGIRATREESDSSRIGFLGMEDLGGGMSAIFQLEGKVGVNTGTGALFARETFLGLAGNFGAAKLGNMDPPIDEIKGIVGNSTTFVTSILSTEAILNNNSGNAFGAAGNAGQNNGFPTMNDTMPNSVKYETPVFGSVYGSAMYSHLANQGTGLVPHAVGANIVYAAGPNIIALATSHDTAVMGSGLSDQVITAAGSTIFGPLKVGLTYSRQSADYIGGTAHRNYWATSGTYSIGVGKIFAYYGRAGNGSVDHPGLSETGASIYELSYSYLLSKRTTLYTGYVKINNQANATYQIGVNGIAGGTTDPGASVSGFIMGIRHTF
jgi:predicted porin